MITPDSRPSTPRPAERGFSLVELLVVLLIVGILMAIGVSTQNSAKRSSKRQEAIVAAHTVQKAVEGFRRDREGRVPSRQADWPVAAVGPVDADLNRRYMGARLPDTIGLAVQREFGGRRSDIVPAVPPPPGSQLRVQYAAVAATRATESRRADFIASGAVCR